MDIRQWNEPDYRPVTGPPPFGQSFGSPLAERVELYDPPSGVLANWFCNEKYSPVFQYISAFVLGVLVAPWSSGLFFLIVFIIVYELAYYTYTHGNPKYYSAEVRAGVILASVLGWIMGRAVSDDNIFQDGVPLN